MFNRRMHMGVSLSGLVALAGLAASPRAAAEDVRAAIEAANDTWEAAAARGDSAAVAGLYTTDAQLLPSGSDVVRGTNAIAAFWQAAFDSGVKGVTLTALEVDSCGDAAHEVGKLEIRDADGKLLDHAKYVVVWKKEGGSWKLHRDIWTTSVAPAKN